MKNETVIITKKIMGSVSNNDGEFAEIQTFGVEGIEACILLDQIYIERSDTNYDRREFRRRFRVGRLLDVVTTVQVTPTTRTVRDLEKLERVNEEEQRKFEA